jgi:hypothetical protein
MKDDLGTILDALHTKPLHLDLKKLPRDANPLMVLAHEAAKVDAYDDFKLKLAKVVVDCEYDGLYKHVEVNMRGVNGNVFMILGTVKRALQKAKADPYHVEVFMHRAMSGNYEHALSTCSKWVTIVDRRVEQCALKAFKQLPKEED